MPLVELRKFRVLLLEFSHGVRDVDSIQVGVLVAPQAVGFYPRLPADYPSPHYLLAHGGCIRGHFRLLCLR